SRISAVHWYHCDPDPTVKIRRVRYSGVLASALFELARSLTTGTPVGVEEKPPVSLGANQSLTSGHLPQTNCLRAWGFCDNTTQTSKGEKQLPRLPLSFGGRSQQIPSHDERICTVAAPRLFRRFAPVPVRVCNLWPLLQVRRRSPVMGKRRLSA